jgi:hypothetical protein
MWQRLIYRVEHRFWSVEATSLRDLKQYLWRGKVARVDNPSRGRA